MDDLDSGSLENISSLSDTSLDKKTETCQSFSSVKPWYFKPRKSKYGFQDDCKKIKKYNSLHWSPEENGKYVQFLKGFLELIKGDTLQKRKYHLNRMLSKHIGSRSPVQCRSHHQKMIKAFKTPENIIANLEKENSPFIEKISRSQELTTQEMTPFLIDSLPVNFGTNTEPLPFKQSQKVEPRNFNEGSNIEEASLWDVLTILPLEDSLNDLL